ncbi:MAG: hypothetical protein ACM3YE_08605, partial [Bacteroidota bacterium]
AALKSVWVQIPPSAPTIKLFDLFYKKPGAIELAVLYLLDNLPSCFLREGRNEGFWVRHELKLMAGKGLHPGQDGRLCPKNTGIPQLRSFTIEILIIKIRKPLKIMDFFKNKFTVEFKSGVTVDVEE